MIHVADLTKSFGPVRALDRVSFSVGEREILGFLGPNGAGKTTTLRILTGFLPADGGTATVAGCDVRARSLEARRRTGYLPEGVPLYPEMRAGEYLRFRARLKGVERSRRRAEVARALALAGVAEVERRIVGTLSRGYRQRVGLADALLGDPPVLILDEPSVGLDPEQVRQFRALLRELGSERSVVFSTHILGEVEQVASRVTIIHRGRVLAHDTPDGLRRKLGALDRIRVEVAGPSRPPVSAGEIGGALEKLPGVASVKAEAGGNAEGEGPVYRAFTLRPREGHEPREAVFRLARDRGWLLRELSRVPLPLEELYLEIVGEEGRR